MEVQGTSQQASLMAVVGGWGGRGGQGSGRCSPSGAGLSALQEPKASVAWGWQQPTVPYRNSGSSGMDGPAVAGLMAVVSWASVFSRELSW